jgi:NAD(P)-dependent dehydrogenase (short-subunit alcohol dehydrogenase family)
MPRVFFITGCSTGLGKSYAQEVIDRGDIVVATARSMDQLRSFKNATEQNFLPLVLDVTQPKSISDGFAAALDKFSRIDVVVNNAGYGLAGCFEEYDASQIRQQMEVNFFGLLDVTREALLVMRTKNTPPGGVIQQVTSVGGQRGVAGFSLYCASKWAVEGFSEAVSKEMKPEWNIKLTCLEPGSFRTDWTGRSMTFARRLDAYDHLDIQRAMDERHGTQAGDPDKGARVMYELAVMKDPPVRVAIGSDSYNLILKKLQEYGENYKKYEHLSCSTDYDN